MLHARRDDAVDLEQNPVVRLARRFLPFSQLLRRDHFFTRTADGRLLATPLLLVLLVVEWSDLVFAIDSIPAIFAITRDPVPGLQLQRLRDPGTAGALLRAGRDDGPVRLPEAGRRADPVFVGLKMTLSAWLHVPTLLSLAVIVLTLATAVVLSLRRSAREARQPA